MPTASRDVRSQGQSRRHLLALSFSVFEPTEDIVDNSQIDIIGCGSKIAIGKKRTAQQMQEISLVSFSGVFALRDGVSEKEFLPRLDAFLQHFIDTGFATSYRVMRREALDGFGKTLPAFTYRGEPVFPDLEREHAAYEYVKQHGEQVTSLHVAMNSMVKPDADFFFRDAHRIAHECLPLALFETCRRTVTMSVPEGRPEVVCRRPK
ncbi:DUF6614 family protein [Bradyrhizobium erythrophlei]|uniref:Uncharacterized protein n=1 Tax=Bradyrhizobium erythrophlei TaxID=1437360 RepID=A0A1M5U775_9BRAD|nr:DUF6614 family protein [Bradyrhizobium erythrophlei]SHH58760.1 hypothetical protein SAMN05444169_8212 [Bradyrhizobium erythrophlei]